jgi:thiol-disulfide isomerase/thioredoxin
MRWRRWLLWGTVTVVAVVLLAVFGLRGGHSITGRSAPSLPSQRLSGARVTLASVLAGARGKPALVVFWASWCTPCAQEAPTLQRFYRSVSGRLVGVDTGDTVGEARSFIHRFRWTFPNVRDGEGTVRVAYHVTVLPTTVVIDKSGHIRAALRGPQTAASLSHALAAVERA